MVCSLCRPGSLGVVVACVAAGLGFGVGEAIAQPTLTPVDFGPAFPGASGSGLSGDGLTIIGSASDASGPPRAFRWTSAAGTQGLPALPGVAPWAEARAVNFDGTVVIGGSFDFDDVNGLSSAAVRWTLGSGGGGVQSLGNLPGRDVAEVRALTADGNTVVGYAYSNTPPHNDASFRWTPGGGITPLGVPPLIGGGGVYVSAISGSGAVMAGSAGVTSNAQHAFRWDSSNGTQDLGVLAGNNFSAASGISADGSTLIGQSGDFNGTGVNNTRAFRWTSAAGLQEIGLPGAINASLFDVSGDGSVVLGYSQHMLDPIDRTFVWTAATGAVETSQYLSSIGLDVSGWTMLGLIAISDDGRVMLGSGVDANGVARTVLISGVPAPGGVVVLGLAGLVGLVGARRRR